MNPRRLGARIALLPAVVVACTSAGAPAIPVASPVTAVPTSSTGTTSIPGSPSAVPIASPVRTAAAPLPALDATYTSPSYGYQIAFPRGWMTTDGKAPWPAHTTLGHNDPHLDVIWGAVGSGQARFIGASQRVPAGTTPAKFLAEQGQNVYSSPCGVAGDSDVAEGEALPRPLQIDGLDALADLDGCGSWGELGGLIWDIVVVTPNGRGYNFTFDGALHASDVAAWLATIRLSPAAAREAP